jgi:RNA polymerase sigma factor (sigma-70 family)
MTDSQQLLTDYAHSGSNTAFETLVKRHLDMVYSTALRLSSGDTHQAQDAAQIVFIDLARLAKTLSADVHPGGWLHRHTCFVVANALRADRRRKSRERQAVEMNAFHEHQPSDSNSSHLKHLLDDTIDKLPEPDRTAILLRFFEQRDFRGIGQALGSTEDAARMRVTRALEKLGSLLKRRGVTTTSAALATVLVAEAVHAAPSTLGLTITSVALSASTTTGVGTGVATTTIKAITMTTLQKITIAAVITAGVVTPMAIQHRTQTKLREENQSLRQQLDQQAALTAENERLSTLIADAAQTGTNLLPQDQLNELLRLRGEVGRLRAESRELADLKATVKSANAEKPANPLRKQLELMPDKYIPELQSLDEKKWADDAARGKLETEDGVRQALGNLRRAAKLKFVSLLSTALNEYVKANNGQLPNDIAEIKPYLKYTADEKPVDDIVLQRYQLLHTGKMSDFPSTEPLIAEKAPVDEQYDTVFQVEANGYSMRGIGKWSNMGFTNTYAFSK